MITVMRQLRRRRGINRATLDVCCYSASGFVGGKEIAGAVRIAGYMVRHFTVRVSLDQSDIQSLGYGGFRFKWARGQQNQKAERRVWGTKD